jgi:hypothetical protein
MVPSQFIKTLMVMELGLLGVYGAIQIVGLLILLVTGQFQAQVNKLNEANNLSLDTTPVINSANNILQAVNSISGIASALALAVFVISVGLFFYAIYQNVTRER